jgi:hypothetical protein
MEVQSQELLDLPPLFLYDVVVTNVGQCEGWRCRIVALAPREARNRGGPEEKIPQLTTSLKCIIFAVH